MDRVSLQYLGVPSPGLLAFLLIAICLALLGGAVWQFIKGRYRHAVACLAAVLPPTLVPVLAVDAAYRFSRGEKKQGRAALIAAIAVGVASLLALLLVAATGFTAGAAWFAVLGLWVAAAIGVFYAAVFSHLGFQRILTLMIIRVTAILLLLLVLFRPAITVAPEVAEIKAFLPVLVDRSGSMSTVDETAMGDRYTQAVQMLKTQTQRLNKHFRPRFYHFAENQGQVPVLDDLSKLHPSGPGTEGTNIARAIHEVAREAAPDALAGRLPGIIVISDGIHNASDMVLETVRNCGLPVFTVGVGGTSENQSAQKNIELLSAEAPLECVKNNITTITCRVKVSGFPAAANELMLYEDDSDQPVVTERVWTDKNVDTVTVKLKWTPKDAPGAASAPAASPSGRSQIRKLRVLIPPNPAEAVNDDNHSELHVLVTEPRIRVLYVEGSMRPEYKFLRRMLDSDANVQLMSLVRLSSNKFWVQGNITGRQLFNLPATDDEFKLLDVIILGDLDRSFMTTMQMKGLRDWVNNGGGLIMIGGQKSLGPGGYGETDVEHILPVELGGRAMQQDATPFLPQITSAGEEHPILDGIAKYFPGPNRRAPLGVIGSGDKKDPLPDLRGCVSVGKPKAGAQVLAINPTRDVGPVLAVQRFGAGRTAVFTPDTTWQWYLPLMGLGADSPYTRFWGQMVRWLANVQTKAKDAQPSVVLRLDRSYLQVGQAAKLIARVQDEKGKSPENGRATYTIRSLDRPDSSPDIKPMTLKGGSGLFEDLYKPRQKGKYELKVTAADSTGRELGSDSLILTVAPYSSEMAVLARDEKLLREIADQTQATYRDISGLPDMIDQLVERQKMASGPAPKPEIYNLAFALPHPYDFVFLFLVFVALLTAEWLLRRKWNLH
ncbi:MAG: hypothetical protein BWX88_02929 [Planctomycetes bacterium ADurb.Bin126]|mgnify:CR=1 FL=1|nr:MAG: hypothetical protein BWX88_02929 [Planctomycetes bacterium ADurb.Bin126]HOD80623.1 hypothetical protein [Phycisphaerae bacterium]HQL74098.1 hypothetical protein [Phycisphaerae bacterium]